MERSEPTLVPEWLKAAPNGTATTTHHSPSLSDESTVPLPAKTRSLLNTIDCDSPAHLERSTSSSFFHRSSSSNGAVGHEKDNSSHSRSYSSFGRSHRDREWDEDIFSFREKDRTSIGDLRDHDHTDPDIFITSRIEKDMFRRSQSMISAKRTEIRSRRSVRDTNHNHNSLNGAAGGNKVVNIHKATFERDFPSLGAEEKHGIDRVVSPGLSIPAQSLPMGTSAVIMGNGWTSALAEVPAITVSNSTGLSSVPQAATSSSGSLTPGTTTGLNMAETLAQAPLRTRAAPQLSLETQRLEELAIKQSRQLIPMTPSMPKNLVSNLEKQKPKASVRNEMSMANKVGAQPLSSSQPVSHLLRGGLLKSDVTKMSNGGKLLVLKAARENGTSHAIKDNLSPTNAGKAVSNPVAAVSPSFASAPTRSQNNSKPAAADRKTLVPPLHKTSSMEKKPFNSQAQSRSDFFNLMRKKTLTNNSSSAPDPEPAASAAILDKSGEMTSEVNNVVSPQRSEIPPLEDSSLNADHGVVASSNGDASENFQRLQNNGEKHFSSDASLYPDEEEAAFLRSLGWEEDAGEEEGLTEEEINAFYQEYMKLKPSSKLCQGIREQRPPLQVQSAVNNLSGGSSSETKTKA